MILAINYYKFQVACPAPYKPGYLGSKDAFIISEVVGIEQFSLAGGPARYIGDAEDCPKNWIAV